MWLFLLDERSMLNVCVVVGVFWLVKRLGKLIKRRVKVLYFNKKDY